MVNESKLSLEVELLLRDHISQQVRHKLASDVNSLSRLLHRDSVEEWDSISEAESRVDHNVNSALPEMKRDFFILDYLCFFYRVLLSEERLDYHRVRSDHAHGPELEVLKDHFSVPFLHIIRKHRLSREREAAIL